MYLVKRTGHIVHSMDRRDSGYNSYCGNSSTIESVYECIDEYEDGYSVGNEGFS